MTTVILRNDTDWTSITRSVGLRHRVLVRLRAAGLDQALAAGADPDTDLLRSLRATHLVSPGVRARLADAWSDLLHRAAEPSAALVSTRLPVAREILAVSADVDALTTALRATGLVSARGVAAARLLLVAGDSPVYQPGVSADRLGAAVRHATRLLTEQFVPTSWA